MPNEEYITFLGRFNSENLNDIKWIKSTMDQTPEQSPELDDPFEGQYVSINEFTLDSCDMYVCLESDTDKKHYNYIYSIGSATTNEAKFVYVSNAEDDPVEGSTYYAHICFTGLITTADLEATLNKLKSSINYINLYNSNGGLIKELIPVGEITATGTGGLAMSVITLDIEIYPNSARDAEYLINTIFNSYINNNDVIAIRLITGHNVFIIDSNDPEHIISNIKTADVVATSDYSATATLDPEYYVIDAENSNLKLLNREMADSEISE